MKKLSVIAMVLVVALCLSCLVACSNSGTTQTSEKLTPVATEKEDTSATEETTQIANPWTYTEDASEAEQASGLALNLPEGAQNVVYGVLDNGEDSKLLEMSYTDEAGTQIVARAMPTGEAEDISGMASTTTTWDSEEAETVSTLNATLKTCQEDGEGNTIELVTWYDAVPGISYSVMATSTDLDGFDPIAVAEAIYQPMQGED